MLFLFVNRVHSLVDPNLIFDGINSLRGCPKNQDGYGSAQPHSVLCKDKHGDIAQLFAAPTLSLQPGHEVSA